MDSADLPEESKPASSPSKRESGGDGTGTLSGVNKWRPIQFIRDVRLEMKKVTWPTRAEVTSTTVVVLISVAFFAVYLWGVDNLLELFFRQLEAWLH